MRLLPAEFAILNLTGAAVEGDPEYMPTDKAWQCLQQEVERGYAPAELGEDLARWAAWIDIHYTRLRERAPGPERFRILRSATATGKQDPGKRGFARVVLSVEPLADSSSIVVDTSRAITPGAHQPSEAERDEYLEVVSQSVHRTIAYYGIVGISVSILEIHVHPVDSKPASFEYAASTAMNEAIRKAWMEHL